MTPLFTAQSKPLAVSPLKAYYPSISKGFYWKEIQLEQLERLRSENTPPCPMITHTTDSYRIKSHYNTKSQLRTLKKLPKIQILEFWKKKKKKLDATHPLKLLDMMCKYEMDPASIVEDTEQTRFCPQMDGRTDRRTDGRKTSKPCFQLHWSGGYNYMDKYNMLNNHRQRIHEIRWAFQNLESLKEIETSIKPTNQQQ